MPNEDFSNESVPLTERQTKVIEILEIFLVMAKRGDLLSVFVAADHLDNDYRCKYSSADDIFSLMGYVIGIATTVLMRQLRPEYNDDERN